MVSVDSVGVKGEIDPLRVKQHTGDAGYSLPRRWNGVGRQRLGRPLYPRERYPLPVT
jgi:hypothetical protein